MMKAIENRNRVSSEEIKLYDQIDGYRVMEDLLLFKGEHIAEGSNSVPAKWLDEMAIITYGLKSNATNKLYVGFYLDRFYHKEGLVLGSDKIKVPLKIYEKVKELNNKFRNP